MADGRGAAVRRVDQHLTTLFDNHDCNGDGLGAGAMQVTKLRHGEHVDQHGNRHIERLILDGV